MVLVYPPSLPPLFLTPEESDVAKLWCGVGESPFSQQNSPVPDWQVLLCALLQCLPLPRSQNSALCSVWSGQEHEWKERTGNLTLPNTKLHGWKVATDKLERFMRLPNKRKGDSVLMVNPESLLDPFPASGSWKILPCWVRHGPFQDSWSR